MSLKDPPRTRVDISEAKPYVLMETVCESCSEVLTAVMFLAVGQVMLLTDKKCVCEKDKGLHYFAPRTGSEGHNFKSEIRSLSEKEVYEYAERMMLTLREGYVN